MEVVNFEALIAEGKITTLSKLDQGNVYLQLGVYQKGNRKSGGKLNAYDSFVISAAQLLRGATANNTLFQEITDVSNNTDTETELYANDVIAGKLAANGDSIKVQYALKAINNANTKTIRVYFAGQSLFESINVFGDVLNPAFNFYVNINVTLIRTGNSTARTIVTLDTNDGTYPGYTIETDLTGLNFSNTNQIVLTGQTSGGESDTNNVVAKFAKGVFEPAAA